MKLIAENGVFEMIKNNLEIDVKVKCIEEGVTQTLPGYSG